MEKYFLMINRRNLAFVGIQLLLKVLKHIKIYKVYRNGQRVTCYSGVYWNCRPLNDTNTIQWEVVTDLLPKPVIVLRQDSECISIGLKSNTYCNGNFIMKEINLLRKKDDIDLNYC